MAEEHILTAAIGGTTTTERLAAVMFKLWEFVNASAILKFVVDTSVPAVFDGSVYGTPSDQTFFENDGARITVEAVDGTVDWQCKLKVDTVAEDLLVQYGPAGGWLNAAEFGANPTSGERLWGTSSAPLTTASLYISAADTDLYPYLRCVIFDVTPVSAFYVGGYIPIEPSPNTQPHCLLAGFPDMGVGAVTASWGYITADVNNGNRVPAEYPPITTDLVANGHAFVASVQQVTQGVASQGYSSTFVQVPVFICATAGNCLGFFGPFTMYAISDTKADRDTTDTGDYIVFNDFAMRWNP